jgi:hypothetical protein
MNKYLELTIEQSYISNKTIHIYYLLWYNMLNKLSITLQSLKYGITERTNEKLFLFVLLDLSYSLNPMK